MERYYPYDVFSTERITETATVEDGLIQLRHTPKYRSVVIDGFEETDSISLPLNHFRVDYSLDTYYRESNRLLHFNPENDGKELTISYIACGTVITADDMNEIKAHLESDHSKYYQLPTASMDIKGGVRIGQGLYMTGDILNVSGSSGGSSDYVLPIASATQLGGVKIGSGLSMSGDTLNADFTGLVLGEGLAFDEDGKLCVVKQKNSDGWAYQDSGYDVIPAAPLIYVDETHFYQPEINGTKNDMFNTPEGIMEFWIRCDLKLNRLNDGDVFHAGFYSHDSNSAAVSFYNEANAFASERRIVYLNCKPAGTRLNTGLKVYQGNEYHILLHGVSHPTDGYVELTLNYGTYRKTGNVNDGNPFDSFFVYSSNENVLFSNFVVSSTQLEY